MSQSPEESPEKNFRMTQNDFGQELKARLYDKGFKVQTMPSVKRPDTKQSTDKILTAKLISLKSRVQKLEPMVYQKQSTVLHSQLEHARMTQGAFFSQTNEVKGLQRPTIVKTISQTKYQQTQNAFYQSKGDWSRGQSREGQQVAKTSSMMNLPSHRTLLPPIAHDQQDIVLQSQNQSQQQKKEMKMTLGTLGFSQGEMQRTKYLVDKVSGKFNMDKRYLAMMPEEEQIYLMGNTGSSMKLHIKEEDEIIEQQQETDQFEETSGPKRAPSKLDKYIDLILKNVTNVDEFIYLKREDDGDDDPYKLTVVDYKTIKGDEKNKELKEYYTISRKGLCHYMNGKPIEFIQLAYWLKERETYHQIKSLKFFTKFRKWKTLKMWRQNVIRHKTSNCAKALDEKLFYLNPILRETLLSVRKNTYDMMETSRFIGFETSQYAALSGDSIFTLDQFKQIQETYRKKVNDRIRTYSNECRKIVQVGFDKCLDILRKNHYVANNEDEFGGAAQQAKATQGGGGSNFFRLKESAYENLSFPDNMSYEKRSELRKECSKFIRFSYLMDFLAMESLSNIYTLSVRDLITKLQSLVDIEDSYVIKDPATRNPVRFEEPLFQIKLESNFQAISDEYYVTEEVPEFIPPPFGNSKIEDFKLLYHVHLQEDKPKEIKEAVAQPDKKKKGGKQDEDEQEVEEEDAEAGGGYNEEKMYLSVTIPNICKLWIVMKPNLDMFYSDIVKCIAEGLNSIQAFERWSRHDDMTQYVSVLEEWDDMVGEDWEHPDSNYLNPQDWLDASPFETFSGFVRQLLEKAFDRSNKYIEFEFTKHLIVYWENQQLNLDIFKDEKLAHPGETFQYALAVLNLQKDIFQKEIPFESYQGLFKIDSSDLKSKLEPQPVEILKTFESFMTPLLRFRMKELKEWLQQSTSALKGVTTNIDDFVKQSNSLKQIQKQLPKIKSKIQLVGHIYNILDEYHIEVKKEDKQAYNLDIIQTQNTLEQAIHHAEEGAERNLERFARDVTHLLIPGLEKSIGALDSLVQQKKYTEAGLDLDVAINELAEMDEQCKKLEADGKRFNHYEHTLGMPISRFQSLEDLRMDLNLRYSMWKSLKEWKGLISSWIDGKFVDINTEEIRSKGEYYTKVVNRCQKALPSNPILDELRDLVFSFKDTMPVVLALRNRNLKSYHWDQIKEIIGKEFEITDTFTLKNLMDMEVVKHQELIQEISTQATQEAVLESQFNDIEGKWKKQEFVVVPYKPENPKNKEVYVLSEIDDLFAALDEYLANLNNILGSRYLKLLRPKAEKLHKDVLYAQETLDDWLAVQKNWIYLENIFSSADIKTKLKDENVQFENVDKTFKQHMRRTNGTRFVSRVITIGLLDKFRESKETLNKIQKALENYLEDKRNSFPRFYFLSNDELLEILAKSNDIDALQKNIKKCFEAIYRLDFGEEGSRIVQGMLSPEGERVKFNKSTPTKAEVEQWLMMVQDNMVETLLRLMKIGKQEYENMERKNWVMNRPAQVVATVSNIMWTSYTEQAIIGMQEDGSSLAEWYNHNYRQLSQLTELVRQGLTSLEHLVIVALITQDVHARDIVETLTDENVTTLQDFLWQQQLRYYWEEQIENILVRQVNFSMRYGYEYLGATTRLVITPLTDRCWMTITGALNIQLGAAPAGPAGTGKTESTKDLAKALGMFCVVFNCSEQIEYKMMARLFSGLAQQGAWSCLDEFNRIDIEVLSVIAQQLLTVRQALLRHDKRFVFSEREINLHPNFGVFITMNPGYAGRTELPDNLKVLFRPVSMMIPDYRLIAEIMLFAEGFENAKPLSLKMTQLYKLSSEQLSQQDHYDFGMRAVKSVLVMAGKLKRAEPNLNEEVVLIRAMRDSNVPKFLRDDLPLFSALISDLFPGVVIPEIDYGDLQTQIEKSLTDLKFQRVPQLITKVIQLFETFNVRFGVMLVGLTGSGKTTCYQTLEHTMSELRRQNHIDQRFQLTQSYILNPKCISMGELYGEVNPFTQEWQDGLASYIMREAAGDETQERKWVVFDGPVDALWIENMNTVLDDNMMLCLANGQRIKLRPQMRMLFEVQDLRVASPATVSRCGMVYLTQEDLGWKPYVNSWVEKHFGQRINGYDEVQLEILSNDKRKYLQSLFDEYVDDILDKLRSKGWKETIATTDLQLVTGLCNLLEAFINEKFGFKTSFQPEFQKRFITYSFAFAVIWSIGASIDESHHDAMNDYIRDRFQSIIFPNVDTVYAYYLETTNNELSFKHWNDKTPEFLYDSTIPYFNMLVPTIDTVRYSFIVEWLLVQNKLVYMTGSSGTGKSVIVQSLLSEIQEARGIDPIYLIFSAQTTSYVTQLTIEGKLEKIKKALLGAKPGRSSCIFIDDVNMPALEEYGAQPPIELLRLLVDKHFLYDRKERFQKFVENTTLLCCSAPPGGGRNAITPRFTRHFNMVSLPKPSDATLFKIFHSILSGFFSGGFTDAVKRSAETITSSSIEVYMRISKEKLPIPSKFHYTFNLRDVSKVFQGLLMVKPGVIRDAETITKLWVHEICRVFHDRLINDEDRLWFKELICDLIGRAFKSRWGMDDIFGAKKILFGDLLRLDSENRDYEEIKDLNKLIKVLDDKLDDYNMDFNSKTKLVFFDDAIDHILRVARVLRQPRGNAMLIGVGGSGKQSLTRLSAYMLGLGIKSIEIKKNYHFDDFHDFLKELMKTCAIDQVPLCFLFTDSQIVYEGFLEDINNMLNSGEVPNLWKSDEKDPLLNGIRTINAKLKRPEDPDTLYKTFVEQVRDNLHITLCMSPVGDALRVRCRKFPALVDCCTLDWYSAWPPEALVSVAQKILVQETSFPSSANLTQDQLIEKLAVMCKEIHVTASTCAVKFESALKRKVYTTPKSYLDLIGLYLNSLKRKREELQLNQKRLSNGLTKLEQANKQVAELQVTLTELQPQLEVQSVKVAQALEKVEADSRVAADKEAVVQREAEEVNKKASDIKIIADDAQADLDKVQPELDKAQAAVENIDKNALNTIRSYAQPPAIVQLVLEGVLILLGTKTDWATAKQNLQDLNGFINKLLTYPKDNIPEVRLNALKKILAKEEFTPDQIRARASAAADLCQWCIAMNVYSGVSKKVEPKKKKVAELTQILEKANQVLKEKESELDIVKQAVTRLKKETDEMLQKKMDLERLKDLTEARLERAQKLITLTADEAKRWAETVQSLGQEIENLVGDVFLSAAAISYNGPFTGPYRQELVQGWLTSVRDLEIPVSDNFSVIRTLGDPMQLRDWVIHGLPSDSVSQENSIFATQGYRWPLMIDPQMQANNWIRQANKSNNGGIKVLKFSESSFQMHMKSALMNGYVVLIQDVEEALDPSIETILGKQIKEVDGRVLIKFGEQEIDYDKNFRLYLTTKIPNPKYLPEIFIKVTVINFTVTFEGLEDQLLADVVKQERPEIEQQKDDNVMNLARYRKSIKESEATILRQLADAEAEKILDNVELIESLEYAKHTAQEINQKIAESTVLEAEIERVRNEYRSVSIRGSVLYFVIKDLSLIDPMYQYSLQYIQALFNKAMRASVASKVLNDRLHNLIDMITRVIYTNVCRGLFEEHKLIFSFLIGVQINRKAGIISDAMWSIFLRGPGVFEKSKQPPNPDKSIIADISWDLAYYLDTNFEVFRGLTSHITKNLQFWKDYCKASDPINAKLDEWEDRISPFERVLVLKVFRSEKIMFAVSNYVNQYLGKYYLEPPKTTMEILYKDSDPATPIIFVLSAGADPTQQVLRFAQDREFESKLSIISLGQGQGRIATAHIEDAKTTGKWVLLQNCHLAKTWMPSLEILVEQIAATKDGIHPEYRLFLTSMPASYFPVSILQNGIKLTTEPPRGLKANLKRSFQDISDEFLDTCPKRDIFHKLTFGMCYFHAIIQERKKFGPLGWNIKYEFNDSDLDTSKTVIKMLLSEGENVPWDAMLFVTGHINYGGRVTDDWDRRCLITILKKFMTTDVLEDTYRFSDNQVYLVPTVGAVSTYITYIDQLPMADDPQVFGMHENANIAFQQQESDNMIKTILSIQPREAGGSSQKTPDQIVLELVKGIQDDMPQTLNRTEGNKDLWIVNEKGLIPSLSTVLLQETNRFNILLQTMNSTLASLAKAIEGIVVMSQDLDSMYFSLLNNQVPKLWEKVAYLSLKGLGSWIRDLKERVKVMLEWIQTGGPNAFWISGFFYPQGFLTGVLQTHARKTGIAIDVLQFSFRILEVDKENCSVRPNDGVYIYGMYMEGAQWKKKTISDLTPGQMYMLMPVIHFSPTDQYQAKAENYSCPVYKTAVRAGVLSTTGQSTNFVLAVDIPSLEQQPEYWTLRGTALLCALKD